VITVGLPDIQRDLRAGDTDLMFVSAAYGVSFGALLLLGGRVADLFGHRRVFLSGVTVFGVASVAAALAADPATLIAARFAQGIGAAFTAPAAMALAAARHRDQRRRGRALAVWGVLASIGATSGNVLSGALLTWISWRGVLLVPAAVSVVVIVAAVRLVPAGPPAARGGRVDVLGAVLVTTGLSTAIVGLGRLHAAWIGVGVALLAAFAVVQWRGADPLVPPALLAAPRRVVALAAIALTAATMTVVFFLLALYFQRILSYSPMLTSAAFAPPAVIILGAGPVAARALARLTPAAVTTLGLAMAAAGLGLLAGLRDDTAYIGRPLAGLVLFAAGAGLTFGAATVAAADGAPPDRAGLVAGIANTAMETGPPLGLAVLVPIAAAHTAALTGHPTGQAGGHASRAAATAVGYGFAFALATIAVVVVAGLTLCTALATRRHGGRLRRGSASREPSSQPLQRTPQRTGEKLP
jgi:hypothetical protein